MASGGGDRADGVAICSACGSDLDPADAFCGQCGTTVAHDSATQASAPPWRDDEPDRQTVPPTGKMPPPDVPARRLFRLRRGHAAAWLTLAVVAIVGVVVVIAATGSGASRPDPHAVQLPAVGPSRPAVVQYLHGSGAALVALIQTTAPLSTTQPPSGTACSRFATAVLPTIGQPASIATLVDGLPDRGAIQVFSSYLAALEQFLPRCARGIPVPRSDLEFAHIVLERYLHEVGVHAV